MNLSFDFAHYVARATDISVKWAMNKHISGKRYEVFIVHTSPKVCVIDFMLRVCTMFWGVSMKFIWIVNNKHHQ